MALRQQVRGRPASAMTAHVSDDAEVVMRSPLTKAAIMFAATRCRA